MEKIITTIVPQLLANLAKSRTYYTQKDLTDYGFPQFLIKRITFHLMRELSSEFNLPGEEWVNKDSDDLLSEWAELQRILKREIQLPAYLAEEVVEKSVRECVGMTIQPGKVIPELLFEESIELDSNQLTERSSSITVNRFLVWSMVRYMEKKNKESLNVTEAKRIIESIDLKIVASYHPLNWLSLVKPLFELSGSTVHSDIFRRFFEYKGKNHLAKEFDLIDDEIKESRFIEILSSPSSIHVEGYKDDQQSLFQEEMNVGEVEAKESGEDLIENQDEMIEDRSDSIPIFQSYRDESVDEPDEWVDEVAAEQVSETEEEVAAEQVSEPEEEVAAEPESEREEDVSAEPVPEREEDVAAEPESEWEEDVEDEPMLKPEEVAVEPVSEREEDVEDEPMSKPEVNIAEEQLSDLEEEDVKVDIQDEELRAPWEEEEEDSYTFITHGDDQDSPVTELKDLFNEEQGEGDVEERQEGVFDEENEIFKRDEPTSDAALLEIDDEEETESDSKEDLAEFEQQADIINTADLETPELKSSEEASDDSEEIEIDDEEEALYSRFKLIQERNESIPESDEDDVENLEPSEESEAKNLEMDSESDTDLDDDSSLLNRFMFDDSDAEDSLGSMESDEDKKVTTIYDELNLVRNNSGPESMDLFGTLETPEFGKKTSKLKLDDKSSDSKTEKSETIQKFSEFEEPESEKDSDDTEVPMWRSFLERDESEAKSTFQFDDKSEGDEEELNIEDSDEKLDEDGFIEEPIYDFTKKEVDLDEKIGDLSNWMKDVREKFIEDLFGDSEDAYEQALSDIMEFDDWKNASKYIEKEIFTRNRIDVYDEVAVDFTDRLHSYFIENKS